MEKVTLRIGEERELYADYFINRRSNTAVLHYTG